MRTAFSIIVGGVCVVFTIALLGFLGYGGPDLTEREKYLCYAITILAGVLGVTITRIVWYMNDMASISGKR